MPTTKTPSSPAAAGTPAETAQELAFDKLITGRLALQTLRSQLDQQADQLRAELAVNRSHERRIDDMLIRLDERLAKHHPAAFAILGGEL
jgi:hypothetical protein